MKRAQLVVGVAAVAVVLAACSSSSKTSSAPTTADTSTTGSSSAPTSGTSTDAASDFLAVATAATEKGYQGTYREPSQGPVAQKGKTVYVVLGGYADAGDIAGADGVDSAAKSLGWKTVRVDGKLNPAGQNAAILQAVAAHPDGIVTVAIDCTNAKAAYQQAKDAKIPLVGMYNFDCNDPKIGGPQLFTATVDSGSGQDLSRYYYNWGVLHADYIIAKTQGKAKTIEIGTLGFINIEYERAGFEAEMAKCTTCSIVAKTNVTASDLGTAGAGLKVGSIIQANQSKANSVFFDNDSLMTAAATTLRSNRHPSWVIAGGEGLTTAYSMVRDGSASALFLLDPLWLGWGAAFNLNEIFAGHAITDTGAGFEIIDKDHNLPAGGGTVYTPHIDYQAAMIKQWTGSN